MKGSTSTTSAGKLEQEEKVVSIDDGVQGHATTPHGRSRSPKSKSEGKHWTTSEESDNGKPRALRVKAKKKVSGNVRFQRGREVKGEGKEVVGERLKSKQSRKGVEVEGEGKAEQENVALKRQETKKKEETATYDDVIQQAATKLARRSKVKALVGAFESGISLQEPESQPRQQQEEVAVKGGIVCQPGQPKPNEEAKVGEETAEIGQPDRVKPEKVVKVGEEGAERGQPHMKQTEEVVVEEEERGQAGSKGGQVDLESQQKEKKGEEQSSEEESKDGQLGQEKGEEHGGEEESKNGQLGQESQQEETEEENKVEDDDGHVTKALTETTKEVEGEPLEPLDS